MNELQQELADFKSTVQSLEKQLSVGIGVDTETARTQIPMVALISGLTDLVEKLVAQVEELHRDESIVLDQAREPDRA